MDHPGERIRDIAIEEDMKDAYLRYAMSVIISRALPDVRDGLKPSQQPHPRGDERPESRAALRAPQVLQNLRRHAGQLPPARPGSHLPHPRPHGAGVQLPHPPGQRPGQLRLARRRPARGHAVHRGPPGSAPRPRCSPTSNTTPSISSPTTTKLAPSRRSCPASSPTCSATGAAGSRSAWPRASRPTTSARSSTASSASSTRPTCRSPSLIKLVPGPDFPTGGIIAGRQGIHESYRTGRGIIQVHTHAHTEVTKSGRNPHHRHRNPLPGLPPLNQGAHRRSGQQRPHPGRRRHARRERLGPPAPRHRTQARRRRAGRPQPSSTSTPRSNPASPSS